jgi:hypothetical protein
VGQSIGRNSVASSDADELARILVYAAGSQSESRPHVLVGDVSRSGFWISWDGRPDD